MACDVICPVPPKGVGGMIRNAVLFRVDGSKAQGWESFSRCLTFAYALQRRRRPAHFLSRLEPALLGSLVKRGDNQWLTADAPVGSADDLEEITREIRRLRPSAVVIDDPHCSPEYLAEIIALGPMVFCLDNDASYRFASQLVVHPLLNKNCADYDVCPGSQVLAGPRYAIVRPGIRRIRQIRGQEPPEPLRCVVALGDDPNNWTRRRSTSPDPRRGWRAWTSRARYRRAGRCPDELWSLSVKGCRKGSKARTRERVGVPDARVRCW